MRKSVSGRLNILEYLRNLGTEMRRLKEPWIVDISSKKSSFNDSFNEESLQFDVLSTSIKIENLKSEKCFPN